MNRSETFIYLLSKKTWTDYEWEKQTGITRATFGNNRKNTGQSVKAKTLEPGKAPLADGTITGLRLISGTRKGRGKWVLRYISPPSKKRKDMGLGTYRETSIQRTRQIAMEARSNIQSGIDPIDKRAELEKQKEN